MTDFPVHTGSAGNIQGNDGMEARNNYKNNEVQTFCHNFKQFRNKRIVLYGIGRFTATLVPEIPDFNIVGLMDRDSANIGKVLYGIPVIGKEEARENADLIIINTSATYWKVIYARIADLGLPVYYLNGELAHPEKDDRDYCRHPYWERSYEELYEKVKEYDVVSFDIFDTLVMRRVYLPQDIYKLAELRVRAEVSDDIPFYQARMEAELAAKDKFVLLDDIYKLVREKLGLSEEQAEKLRKIEIETELQNLVPREDMVHLCNQIAAEKEVYFVSDMYLPRNVIREVLTKCGIKNTEHIWISGEKKADKRSGALWEKYVREKVCGRKAIHIGDNPINDVKMPEMYGIDTYYVMSAAEMLKNSSLGNIVPYIETLDESVFTGLLLARLFNSPFALNKEKGKVWIHDFENMGYVVWGGVIYSFLAWLIEQAKERNISRLLFFARDGYFLEKDYLYIQKLLGDESFPGSCYLPISRRLVLISSFENEDDIDKIMDYPYSGKFSEYMFDRFDITIGEDDEHFEEDVNLPRDSETVKAWICPYVHEITEQIGKEKKNYLDYLESIKISEDDAVIDLWFYGSNQYYLSEVLHKTLTGFYFAVNKAESNMYRKNNFMISCFQAQDDLLAEKCNLYNSALFVESFLTAPYGMIKAVDETGAYICAEKKMNQIYFDDRERMNDGVCQLMDDFNKCTQGRLSGTNPLFIDRYFGEVFRGGMEFAQKIKEVFYYDNAIIQRRESKIFE